MITRQIVRQIAAAALIGLEARKKMIEDLISYAKAQRRVGAPVAAQHETGTAEESRPNHRRGRRKKRTMSPEGRAAVAAAQHRRWAAWRKKKGKK